MVVLLLGYALLYIALHGLAAFWGAGKLYSLWFPAAGVRFAIMWHYGPRLAIPLALAELAALTAGGLVGLSSVNDLLFIGSIVAPPLAYGVAVWIVRAISQEPRTWSRSAPLPFALAALLAPFLGSLASFPWHLLLDPARLSPPADAAAALTTFILGDLLGVLLVAPPLVWLANRRGGRPLVRSMPWPRPLEAPFALALAWAGVAAIEFAGEGLRLTPVLLATIWIGLRFGRFVAWVAILVAFLVVLSLPDFGLAGATRFQLHLLLAGIAATGYLAGSYADAEAGFLADIRKRDRLLFQAERLKALRAMSVAIVHEISQPLSTLSIETKNLARLGHAGPVAAELSESIALVERKTAHLEQMVCRLRRFGGRATDAPAHISAASLACEAAELVAPEARRLEVSVQTSSEPGLAIWGNEIELQQSLANLIRNAVHASPGGMILVSAMAAKWGDVRFDVVNRTGLSESARPGMGVGLLIARAIAAAHGGRIVSTETGGERRVSLILPERYGCPTEAECDG
ncbi:ATP-binding protein [Enterovirga sp. GCM10030262]|uniref:ATP-binding protein n=1 Tax=Enterovirga sp. GCM10030262 TaxID=3273391 RepID=UPI00360BFD72